MTRIAYSLNTATFYSNFLTTIFLNSLPTTIIHFTFHVIFQTLPAQHDFESSQGVTKI